MNKFIAMKFSGLRIATSLFVSSLHLRVGFFLLSFKFLETKNEVRITTDSGLNPRLGLLPVQAVLP